MWGKKKLKQIIKKINKYKIFKWFQEGMCGSKFYTKNNSWTIPIEG